jgi:hypothetical protein
LGPLGWYHVNKGGARFFLSALTCDETQSMFDNVRHGGNHLLEYGQRQMTQWTDIWFSVHPLSFLVSETLIIGEIRDETHHKILLPSCLPTPIFALVMEFQLLKPAFSFDGPQPSSTLDYFNRNISPRAAVSRPGYPTASRLPKH